MVCIGVSNPLKNTTPLFLAKPTLKSVNCPSSPFLGNPLLFIGFLWSLPLKVGFLSEYPKHQSFSSLTPSYFSKVTKFLLKISQCGFLVTTEKSIFVYTLLLSLNISDFSLFFFVKIATPLKKVTPSFPATSLSKLRSCQAPPFWKFGRRFNPSQAEMGGAHYDRAHL